MSAMKKQDVTIEFLLAFLLLLRSIAGSVERRCAEQGEEEPGEESVRRGETTMEKRGRGREGRDLPCR